MHSRMETIKMKMNKAEERVSDIEDKMMENRKLKRREKENY